MLSLTSKALNLVVRTYIDHQCERMTIRRQFDEFCERNRDCLLPKEVVLKDRLNQNLRPNLLLFSTGNHYMGKNTILGLFLNVNHFAPLNRKILIREADGFGLCITDNQISFDFRSCNVGIFFKCEPFCPPQSQNSDP